MTKYLTIAVIVIAGATLNAQGGYRNALDVVKAVDHDYPGLIQGCGGFVDQVAHRLNREAGTVRWGRKARQANGGNPNCDGLTYLNVPGDRTKKVIVDIITSSESPQAAAAWQENLGDNVGNGWWVEPQTSDRDAAAPPTITPAPSVALDRFDIIDQKLNDLKAQADANTAKIQAQINQVVKNAEKTAAPLILKILSLGIAK